METRAHVGWRRACTARFLNFLWGMETNFPIIVRLLQPLFLNFLWGMETSPQHVVGSLRLVVFELPMRDGNVAARMVSIHPPNGFWTSYEGWKQNFLKELYSCHIWFLNFLWGMETLLTFDASHFLEVFLNFLWGMETIAFRIFVNTFLRSFWTSYEGWKLPPFQFFLLKIFVFELPMRDGNFARLSWNIGSAKVFELPMRDGNNYTMFPERRQAAFLNFLWGMETSVYQRAGRRDKRVFELPMRDGNPRKTGTRLRKPFLVFELPMRDGNNSWCTSITLHEKRFWTSYEGWKHDTASPSFCNWYKFLNFLWGMETVYLLSHKWHNASFLNFLWGMETWQEI